MVDLLSKTRRLCSPRRLWLTSRRRSLRRRQRIRRLRHRPLRTRVVCDHHCHLVGDGDGGGCGGYRRARKRCLHRWDLLMKRTRMMMKMMMTMMTRMMGLLLFDSLID